MKATSMLGIAAALAVAVLIVGSALSAFATSEEKDHKRDGGYEGKHEDYGVKKVTKDSYNDEDKKIVKDSYNEDNDQDNDKDITKDSYNEDNDKDLTKDSFNEDNDKDLTKDSYNEDKEITDESHNDNEDEQKYVDSDPCVIQQEAGADQEYTEGTQVCHNTLESSVDESQSVDSDTGGGGGGGGESYDDHSVEQECTAGDDTRKTESGDVDCTLDASHIGTSECSTSGFIVVVQCPGQVEGDNSQSTNIRSDGSQPYAWDAQEPYKTTSTGGSLLGLAGLL